MISKIYTESLKQNPINKVVEGRGILIDYRKRWGGYEWITFYKAVRIIWEYKYK